MRVLRRAETELVQAQAGPLENPDVIGEMLGRLVQKAEATQDLVAKRVPRPESSLRPQLGYTRFWLPKLEIERDG